MKRQRQFVIDECEDIYAQEFQGSFDERGVRGERQKTITSGPIREVEVAQKNLNAKNTRKRIVRLLNANFTKEDIWETLTYDNKHLPKDMKGAKHCLQNYLRRIAYWMKKKGLGELKYLYAIEYIDDGEEVRIHQHVVMNFPDRDVAEKLWKGGGRTQTQGRRRTPPQRGRRRQRTTLKGCLLRQVVHQRLPTPHHSLRHERSSTLSLVSSPLDRVGSQAFLLPKERCDCDGRCEECEAGGQEGRLRHREEV